MTIDQYIKLQKLITLILTFCLISHIQLYIYLQGWGARAGQNRVFLALEPEPLLKNEEPEPLGKKSQEPEPEPVKISRLLSPARR
jgi:hypothetical protein